MNARQLFLADEERRKLIDRLGTFPDVPQRATTAVVRNVLLHSPFFYNGRSYDVKAKSLGAGVWELTVEKEGN